MSPALQSEIGRRIRGIGCKDRTDITGYTPSRTSTLTLAFAILVLSACSGGGGGSSAPDMESSGPPAPNSGNTVVSTTEMTITPPQMPGQSQSQTPTPPQTSSQSQTSTPPQTPVPSNSNSNTPGNTPPTCTVGLTLDSSRTRCYGEQFSESSQPTYTIGLSYYEGSMVWLMRYSGTRSVGYSSGEACLSIAGFVATRAADGETWTIQQTHYPDIDNNVFGLDCDGHQLVSR